MNFPTRYQGKPMLVYLDAYVLDALGALEPERSASFQTMLPKLREALNTDGDTWQQVVESSMDMPADSADALRAMWERHVHETIDAGGTPDALAWTHQIVDARFGNG